MKTTNWWTTSLNSIPSYTHTHIYTWNFQKYYKSCNNSDAKVPGRNNHYFTHDDFKYSTVLPHPKHGFQSTNRHVLPHDSSLSFWRWSIAVKVQQSLPSVRVSLQLTVGAWSNHSSLSLCHLPTSPFPEHLFQGEVILTLTGFISTLTKSTSNTYQGNLLNAISQWLKWAFILANILNIGFATLFQHSRFQATVATNTSLWYILWNCVYCSIFWTCPSWVSLHNNEKTLKIIMCQVLWHLFLKEIAELVHNSGKHTATV